ncbi:hypothetical protein [Anaerotignum sp.]|uniref:hypothetical protein n=1 Tax=Anaerotignum sp. TaxID=2039241 RepID=UPI00289BCF2F|nr:hypothetical protein [Anaerotignum sp.]
MKIDGTNLSFINQIWEEKLTMQCLDIRSCKKAVYSNGHAIYVLQFNIEQISILNHIVYLALEKFVKHLYSMLDLDSIILFNENISAQLTVEKIDGVDTIFFQMIDISKNKLVQVDVEFDKNEQELIFGLIQEIENKIA